MAVDWSSLPLDLISTIALKLETFEDFIYFSVVCRTNGGANPVVPWLLLAEHTNEDRKSVRKIFNLENNKRYKFNLPDMVEARCWGSVHGWIVVVDRDLNVQLFNPITKARIHFPSVTLFYPYANNKDRFDDYEDYIGWFLSFFLLKFIVVKIPPGEFVIMVLYDCGELAFASHGDRSWTKIVSPKKTDGIPIADVASEFGGCGLVKPVNYCPCQPEIFKELNEGLRKIYLEKSGEVLNTELTDYDNDLFYKTIDFQVYRLNYNDRKWEEIEDFGDVALIVASSKSMRRSCIYFRDDEYDMWGSSREKSGHDIGVCDIKCHEISKFYEGGNTHSLSCPPTCFIPRI
ncbi:hypothetical protein RND81_03G158400 [Saponaria officinalis]|uniref:KIB1-4 beta-propeller domain-containing protein n=1 Tax=Saponaria officinalis TaxID=3572 RepID=A0AAW1M4A7_SAPOF